MAGEVKQHWSGRVAAGLVFVLLALLTAAALLGPHPVTALPIAGLGIAFVWFVLEYPRSAQTRGLFEEIDEDAPDWPQAVPLGPEVDDDS